MSKRFLPLLQVFSALGGLFRIKRYRSIQNYCCFIGYSRSGHTMVGSLLDAHPNIVLATEADAFDLIKRGFGKYSLFFYLETVSKIISRVLGNRWTGYDYRVKNSHQGQSENIFTIGDKKGNRSLKRISKNPDLIKKLENTTGLPIKYLHVIRNPFDNIATMHNRDERVGKVHDDKTRSDNKHHDKRILRKKIRTYYKNASKINELQQSGEIEILNIYHEEVINQPKETFAEILRFLGLSVDQEYLAKCAEVIYPHPHQSRYSFRWPRKAREQVASICDEIPFLNRYEFYDKK